MKLWKRSCAVFLCCILLLGLCSCGKTSPNETSEQTVDGYTQEMTEDAKAQMETEVSAFEITKKQRELAKNNTAGYSVLDAGRGNPNWINTKARNAYARLMEYATQESQRTMESGDLAGQAQKEGIGTRFDAAMDPANEVDAFLIQSLDYCVNTLGLDRETVLKEWVDGIIGDYYPSPSRSLTCSEKILNRYLQDTLYNGVDLAEETQLFATEGGSAAMCYIFDSLSHNKLLNPGDKIAIATPIFTPYLEIPHVFNYGLVSVDVSSSADTNWDIAEEELAKLEDPDIKAFFLVNPSNPASHALSEDTLDRLEKVIEKNPDLIILTDDVYGTFVDDFQTVYSRLPHNTILVYSFSKLYGVTGWRLGLIGMNQDNVMDRLLSELSEEDKEYLRKEYASVTEDVDSMPFLERVTADSRSVGLYHTSGLSTPQQIFMDMLALTHLVCEGEDPYIQTANQLVHERYVALMQSLGMEADTTPNNAQYYTLIDIDKLLRQEYGEDFAEWKAENISDLDFLNDLAEKKGVVLMYGPGFSGPEGTVRVSLANLNKEDYTEIGRRIFELLDEYHERFQSGTEKNAA